MKHKKRFSPRSTFLKSSQILSNSYLQSSLFHKIQDISSLIPFLKSSSILQNSFHKIQNFSSLIPFLKSSIFQNSFKSLFLSTKFKISSSNNKKIYPSSILFNSPKFLQIPIPSHKIQNISSLIPFLKSSILQNSFKSLFKISSPKKTIRSSILLLIFLQIPFKCLTITSHEIQNIPQYPKDKKNLPQFLSQFSQILSNSSNNFFLKSFF